MNTSYANQKLALAIRDHLLDVDAVPPTAEASKLAGELAQICLSQLSAAGLGVDTVEKLFAPSALKAKVPGVGKHLRQC
jgi:hypothetical protein